MNDTRTTTEQHAGFCIIHHHKTAISERVNRAEISVRDPGVYILEDQERFSTKATMILIEKPKGVGESVPLRMCRNIEQIHTLADTVRKVFF